VKAEYAAVSARLQADTALLVRDTVYAASGDVFQGSYLVLFGGAPDELDDQRSSRQQDVSSRAVYVYTTRCVSQTPDGVRSVIDKAMTQLIGFTPTISGRKCWAITMTHSTDVQPDTSVKPILFYADLEFTLVSDRA